jgi:hypothetical protein
MLFAAALLASAANAASDASVNGSGSSSLGADNQRATPRFGPRFGSGPRLGSGRDLGAGPPNPRMSPPIKAKGGSLDSGINRPRDSLVPAGNRLIVPHRPCAGVYAGAISYPAHADEYYQGPQRHEVLISIDNQGRIRGYRTHDPLRHENASFLNGKIGAPDKPWIVSDTDILKDLYSEFLADYDKSYGALELQPAENGQRSAHDTQPIRRLTAQMKMPDGETWKGKLKRVTGATGNPPSQYKIERLDACGFKPWSFEGGHKVTSFGPYLKLARDNDGNLKLNSLSAGRDVDYVINATLSGPRSSGIYDAQITVDITKDQRAITTNVISNRAYAHAPYALTVSGKVFFTDDGDTYTLTLFSTDPTVQLWIVAEGMAEQRPSVK